MAGQGGLGERLEMLKAALDNEPVGIAVLAGEELRYVYANPVVQRLAKGDVTGKTYAEVWPTDAVVVVPRLLRVLRTGEPWIERESPWHLPRVPGEEPELAYFTIEVVRYQIGETTFLLNTTVETTEETIVRNQRDRLFSRMHDILQSVSDGISAIDEDYRITYANRQASLLAGAAAGELLGKECWQVLPGLSEPEARKSLTRALLNRQRVEFRTDVANDGRIYLVRVFPSETGAVVYQSDVTEQARVEEERREVTETLRDALLVLPQHVEGVEFAHTYLSANDSFCVGGDFYDLFPVDESRVGVVIGDVSDKGLAAAVTSALARSAIRAFAAERLPPGDVLERASNVVLAATPGDTFFSAFFGVVDLQRGSLEYCNAGHPPPVLRHRLGGTTMLQPTAPVAGAFRGPPFGACVEGFGAGDLLLMYTNGATEARSMREPFGERRLLEHVDGLREMTAKAATTIVSDAVRAFSQGRLNDDVALLAVRLGGRTDEE